MQSVFTFQTYTSNRAPFGLNMHAAWFFTPSNLKATHTFIQRLLQLGDVYIVSAKQVLDWMRNPVKVKKKKKKKKKEGEREGQRETEKRIGPGERERERETDRQTDRQTDSQTEKRKEMVLETEVGGGGGRDGEREEERRELTFFKE